MKNTKARIDADTNKIEAISNQLFGASPIQLDEKTAKRIAKETAEEALAFYRRKCAHAVTVMGL